MLQAWWDVCDADGSGEVDHDEYVALSCMMFKAMAEDYDPQEAHECAERDWKCVSLSMATLCRPPPAAHPAPPFSEDVITLLLTPNPTATPTRSQSRPILCLAETTATGH